MVLIVVAVVTTTMARIVERQVRVLILHLAKAAEVAGQHLHNFLICRGLQHLAPGAADLLLRHPGQILPQPRQ